MGLYAYRIIGAALLDGGVYEGIEADRRSIGQAFVVVLLSSLAAGVGAAGWRGPEPAVLALVAIIALTSWVAWAYLVFQIGGRLLATSDTRTTPAELMRTIGFAAAPGLLQVLAVLPRITVPVFVVAWLWTFTATVVAVRHALDYTSTARAIVVCALAAGLALGVAFVLGLFFGPTVS